MIYYLIASILDRRHGALRPDQTRGLSPPAYSSTPFRSPPRGVAGGGLYDMTSAVFFTFDALGTLFYLLLVVVSMYVFGHSEAYLQGGGPPLLPSLFRPADAAHHGHRRSLFRQQLAVTWIFLEATTLCSAGIIYRRTAQALEAAWKYVFVCSTGIAMAYLGILLLAAATKCETLRTKPSPKRPLSGNPPLPEDGLPADSQRIQLQTGAVPALHGRHRRQLSRPPRPLLR